MPSSWDAYYVVLLSAGLALTFPLALSLASRIVGRRKPAASRRATPEMARTNSRFFLAAHSALLLIALILLLVPAIGTLQENQNRRVFLGGFVLLLSLAALALVGLLYAVKKGDLSWTRDFQKRRGEP